MNPSATEAVNVEHPMASRPRTPGGLRLIDGMVKGSDMGIRLQPQALNAEEGPAFWFLNNLITVKATTESTGGAYSLCHQVSPPGSATPYHLHHVEDEAFYILDGESTFICDGKKTIARSGDYLFLPRGIPHGIRVTGSKPTTMLIFAMPGTGFVGMMEEIGEPAKERVLPPPSRPDLERLTRSCEKHLIDILGPLPE